MTMQGFSLARAELLKALVSRTVITDTDGAVTNDSLIASSLIGLDARKIVEKTILISSGLSDTEDAASIAFNPVNGEVTVTPAFSNRILAGTIVRIINISSVELDVVNILARIGTNLDPAGTTTLFAWFAKVFAAILGSGGLAYGGTVTAAVPGASFTIASLAGLGAGKFASTTQPPYRAYVLCDASGGIGGAPEGEIAAITGYTTASGLFTPNGPPAFTVDIAVGDEVLILHPRIAEILDILTNVGPMSAAATLDDLSDVTTTSAQAKLRRVLLRMSGAAFTATIQGAARTDLAAMMAAMATYLKAAGAAYSATVGGAARADIEASLTALAAYFNAASAALSVVSQPGVAARTNLNDIAQDLADILAGAAGIVNFPAAGAPSNGVSLAEIIRFISDSGRVATVYTASASTVTSITAAALADIAGSYVGQMVVPLAGNMQGQGMPIIGYDGTAVLTVDPGWAQAPGNVGFAIVPNGVCYIMVKAIFDLVNGIQTTKETGGSITTDGNEQTVYIVDTPAGIFKPLVLKIDFTNHTITETIEVRTYHKIESGGAYIQDSYWVLTLAVPANGVLLQNYTLQPNRFGVKATIKKTAGTNRVYKWEVFYED